MQIEVLIEARTTGEFFRFWMITDDDDYVMCIESEHSGVHGFYEVECFVDEELVKDDDVIAFMEFYGFDYVSHIERIF